MSPLPTITPDPADFDWMEIVLFSAAIEIEGYAYAFDNYSPLFRRPELRALETDMGGLRALMETHDDAREAWEEEIGWDKWSELYDAHLAAHRAEAKQRRSEAQTVTASGDERLVDGPNGGC